MWQVISASVQGTSHVRNETPCQDSHGYFQLENCIIAAVADGLGSAAKSDEGSKLAVDTALNVLKHALIVLPANEKDWEKILSHAFDESRSSLEKLSESSGLPLREYGTTLILAAITPDWVVTGHIGDGAVVAFLDNGEMETMSEPLRGEYANEVAPLTSQNALNLVRYSARQISVKAIALLSDGLQNLSINVASGKPFIPFFTPFFDAITQTINTTETSKMLAEFLNSERVCSKTDDDKTLVVIGKVANAKEIKDSENISDTPDIAEGEILKVVKKNAIADFFENLLKTWRPRQ
jgi:hypothetical protein